MSSRLATADLRLLQVFMVVVESQGFAAAQTELNLSTSTISNHMSALEARLGVRLCRRGRAGFAMTPDGEQVFTEAQRLFAAIEGFDFKVSALRSQAKGTIAIGLIDNTISDPKAPLHEVLARFSDRMPNVQLTIEVGSPNELLRGLTDGRLHVAVGGFPRILLGLDYMPIYKEKQEFYCGRGHELFDQPPSRVTRDEIGKHRLISRGYWGVQDKKHLRSERIGARVNSMEAEARLILSGRYLGYLPMHYAAQWVERGLMKPLMPEALTYEAELEIAAPHVMRRTKASKAFIAEAMAFFGVAEADRPAPPR